MNSDNKESLQTPPVEQPRRPQEPQTPYPYLQEDVTYENKASGITLAGILTLPSTNGKFPAVVLISGMGPNDRDYTMLGHKLFLVLADYLTRQGIAVLRFDKRGAGKSTGTFDLTLTSKDFASDVLAGVAYLKTRKEIDTQKIGLIGHSEGGMIASMIASMDADKSSDISFVVLLAPAVATTVDDVIAHTSMQLRADGATEKMIALDSKMRKKLLETVKQEENYDIAEKRLREIIATYLKDLPEEQKKESEMLAFAITEANSDGMIAMFNSPWYRYFLTHDPVAGLKQITIPVLAINGDLDFISSAKIVSPLIAQALKQAENKDYEIVALPNLNHWFQTCKTGAMAEYGAIEETMSPSVLQMISEWILARTKKE
ncbi:alpha/beta hydrolase family protein [Candidatus Dependentiae bacterium]